MTIKSERIVALMIGRGGSSLKDKNILPVLGHPLLHWSAAAATRSKYIGRYYVSSDCERILATAGLANYKPIRRPDELASDTAQSCDAVRHAISCIERDGPVDILVVQHANVGTISEVIIDACIDQLQEDEGLSSVVPVHEYNEYHPLRAKGVGTDGLLIPYVNSHGVVSANRQDLPTCFFFDHSFWVLRARTAKDKGGQLPWDCMGTQIKPYPTSGCLDVHTRADLIKTEQWILDHSVPNPIF